MFDYIVVGAGTAGCTLAARLSEDPSAHVLLMEAGPPARGGMLTAPSAFPGAVGSKLDWKDSTEPQENLNSRRMAWPRGKVLGGSGLLSASIHLRGCRADYDSWRDLGNPGWGFDDLEPLFTAPPAGSRVSEANRLTQAFLEACESRGIARYEEFNGPQQPGAGVYPTALMNGARWSSVNAFLKPALKRGNLTVWTGIQALRVLLEKGRTAGIEYSLKGSVQQVIATHEVVLCAGAIGSAQLLLLSGIGPKQDLERLGIPVAAESPGVGQNLQDHPAVSLRWTCSQPISLDGKATLRNAIEYRLRRSGPFASNLVEAGAFLKSQDGASACDLEILFAPLYSLDRGLAQPAAHHGFTLLAALLTPASRGRVSLESANPLECPRIDPGYLTEPKDKELLVQVAERAQEIAGSKAFASYLSETPDRREASAKTADDIEERIVSLHHSAGTCRMGVTEDCVTDSQLRVRGIEGLRVADASVMPALPRAHPNATVMAIAEKAARLIQAKT